MDQEGKDARPVAHLRVSADMKAKESRAGAIFVGFITVAIVTLWVVKARKHDPRDLSRIAPATPTPTAQAPAAVVAELSVSGTASALARRDEVSRALAPLVPRAAACMEGIYGTAYVDVVFAPNGAVSEARFARSNKLPVDELLHDTCVLTELRTAKIAPGPPDAGELVATFPVRNMPSQGVIKRAAEGIVGGKATVEPPP